MFSFSSFKVVEAVMTNSTVPVPASTAPVSVEVTTSSVRPKKARKTADSDSAATVADIVDESKAKAAKAELLDLILKKLLGCGVVRFVTPALHAVLRSPEFS